MDGSTVLGVPFTACMDLDPPKKKRIRARLDHLTPKQKMERRKEKNRIAAQVARDRKRNKIERLEDAVKELQDTIRKVINENQRLREENRILKSGQLPIVAKARQSYETHKIPSLQVIDSGVSDVDTASKSSYVLEDEADGGYLAVPRVVPLSDPTSPTSTTEVSSQSPIPNDEYIDSIIGNSDEVEIVDDIRRLENFLYSDMADDGSLESAALINAPQQQVQETSGKSLLLENSVGWTSIQLMLLLMITRVHRRLSVKINCCVREPRRFVNRAEAQGGNLYDYILQTKCVNLRRTAEAIISSKNNVRQQKLAALQFVYTISNITNT